MFIRLPPGSPSRKRSLPVRAWSRRPHFKRLLVGFARDETLDSAGRVLIARSCATSRNSTRRSGWSAGVAFRTLVGCRLGGPAGSHAGDGGGSAAAGHGLLVVIAMPEHTSVLLCEAVEALGIVADGVHVDGTFGRGGHSRLILERLGPAGRLVAFDRDPTAIAAGSRSRTPLHLDSRSVQPLRRDARPPRHSCGGRRVAGYRRLVTPTRRRGTRHELQVRCAARHADGYQPRFYRGGLAGNG